MDVARYRQKSRRRGVVGGFFNTGQQPERDRIGTEDTAQGNGIPPARIVFSAFPLGHPGRVQPARRTVSVLPFLGYLLDRLLQGPAAGQPVRPKARVSAMLMDRAGQLSPRPAVVIRL